MRETAVQMVIAMVLAGAVSAHDSRAQQVLNRRVTIHLADQPIRAVLQQLGKTADVRFTYGSALFPTTQRAGIQANGQPLAEVLDRLLTPFNIQYTVEGRQIILNRRVPEPDRSVGSSVLPPEPVADVSGTVTDENGTTLAGVSVVVKGTSRGATTDPNGRYRLTVPSTEGAVLVFSFVGYERQEVPVGNQSVIDVRLVVSNAALDEVVVVGYGTQTKREVTGSIGSIGAQDIKNQTVTGFDQALAGRVAGVQVAQSSGAPGGSTSIRIRGIGTPGNSEPLYVIDGVPVFNNNQGRQSGTQPTGVLNTINPADIESIEILKDAASGAIYGSRAANGVVLITTKKGKSGRVRFNVDYSLGVQNKEKSLQVLDGPTYQRFIQEFSGTSTITNPANTNWENEIFRTAPMQDLNVSASGGSDKSTFLFSIGYLNQEGIVRGSAFDRLSLRLNTAHKVTDRFRIGNNLSISRSLNNQVVENQVFGAAIPLTVIYPPVIPARLPDGTLGMPGDVGLSFIRTNPLVQTDLRYFESEKVRLLGNVYAELDLLKGLTYRLNLGGDFLYGGSDQFLPPLVGRGTPDLVSEAVRFDSREWIWLAEHTLNYSRRFGTDHSLNLLAGFTQQESKYSLHSGTKTGFIGSDLISLDAGATNAGVAGRLVDWALMSFLGRANYSYKGRYFATASIRRDGSSRFAPGKRWGVFPSVSAGWLISDEPFLQNTFISQLKLRGSWGQLGNQEIQPFQYLPLLVNTGGYAFGGSVRTGIFAPQPANQDITWETSTQTDIGFDLAVLSNQLTFSVDYFDKLTEGILLQGTLPSAFGFIRNSAPQFPVVNAGVVRNRGFEFDLGFRNTGQAFQYSINANVATLHNEVESLGVGGPIIRYEEALSTRTDLGQPIGSFYGYVVEGVFQNQNEVDTYNARAGAGRFYQASATRPGDFIFRDINGDGRVTDRDQTYIGSPLPTLTYGATFSATYKGFDFSMAFQGIAGNKIFAKVLQQAGDFTKPDNKFLTLYENAWRGEGTSNTVPRIAQQNANSNYRNSTYFIKDGSYARLRAVQLGYTLPETLLKPFGVANARVFLSGQNLLTFDNYEFGLDPEIGSTFDNNSLNGVDYGRYPIPRIVSVGVNLGF
jgi:TonB-linked SusC/RagA family outer membrane protein